VTWLAWRIQRAQLLACACIVAVLAAWLAVTGVAFHSALLAQLRVCPNGGGSAVCQQAYARTQAAGRWIGSDRIILLALPAVLGLVIGGILVAREIETGTNRLAWTQSISRIRWLVVKLLLAGLLIAAVVGALDPLLAWWSATVQNPPNIDPSSFSSTGFVDVGYALFAFMLGTALGALIRRTGWAMAAGVPLFVGFRLWVMHLRPHFASVEVVSGGGPFSTASYQSQSWFLNAGYVPDGRNSPGPAQNWGTGFSRVNAALNNCRARGDISVNIETMLTRCAQQLKLHWVQQYQPPSHFWAIQSVETGIFAAAALILCGITVVLVQRWRT
jgi:hypothetical protein